MQKKSLEKLLKQTSQIINSRISKIFSTSRKSDILDAMKYSSISQGKKIRPFLIFLSASKNA
jgi:geranylgeranyl pyrophosphate synthase